MTQQIIADLTNIEQRIIDGRVEYDFQNAIVEAETKLLAMGHLEGCLLLSKLSLIHMTELGMTDTNDPYIVGMVNKIPATRTQDFAPLLAKLVADVRNAALD